MVIKIKVLKGDDMISFTTINCDDEYEPYIFMRVEEILKIFWSDCVGIPAMEDKVFNGNFIWDNNVFYANDFSDIIEE